jgi:2-keto-4-pentenoate hydratase/2-oxohepta-3-ene-1,7-dioic acid hydratase in catechol pathway
MNTARIYRIEHQGAARYVVEDAGVMRLVEGDVFDEFGIGEEIGAPRLLPPVMPSKIVAVGLNYRDHALETRQPLPAEPLIFIKPPSAVIGPGDAIRLPQHAGRVDYEAEVAVVIRRRARHVPAAEARDYILGLTCANDVTERDMQKRDGQFTRAKGFDTFAPIGPCIAPYTGQTVTVEAWVNGERRQASSTRELIFPIETLVEFVTGVMTLLPGDIISTGTPSGIGPLRAGDRVTIKVEGVGELTNTVIAEQARG